MSREIKFRAWIPKELESEEYEVEYEMCYDLAFEDYEPINDLLNNQKNLMQYTGLKDKNEVEIYEGDIVEFVGGTCHFLPCGIYEHERYKVGDRMIVQCLLSGFTLAGLSMIKCETPNRVGKVDNYTFWNHQKSLEVIGNIYENESLLIGGNK